MPRAGWRVSSRLAIMRWRGFASREAGTVSNRMTTPLALLADQLKVLRFYSRLPLPVFAFEPDPHGLPDFSRAAWAVPIAGAIIAACGAATGVAAWFIGLSIMLTASLTIATLVIVTGAFHEDGMADSFDGLFGGATPERRLEIMKDSRIGSFGGAALFFSLSLRVLALAELFRLMGPLALLLVIGIGAASRALALAPVLFMPPAGTGLAARVAMPGPSAVALATGIGIALILAGAAIVDLASGALIALMAAGMAIAALARLAKARIGGHTGDILGACQQLAEIVMLIALSAAANWRGPI